MMRRTSRLGDPCEFSTDDHERWSVGARLWLKKGSLNYPLTSTMAFTLQGRSVTAHELQAVIDRPYNIRVDANAKSSDSRWIDVFVSRCNWRRLAHRWR